MDDHQVRVLDRIGEEIDEYIAGNLTRPKLIDDLRGLVLAADVGEALLNEFMEHWMQLDSELELLVEP